MDIQIKRKNRDFISRGCVVQTDGDVYLVAYYEGYDALVSLESNQIFQVPSVYDVRDFIEENLDEEILRVIQPENIQLREVD